MQAPGPWALRVGSDHPIGVNGVDGITLTAHGLHGRRRSGLKRSYNHPSPPNTYHPSLRSEHDIQAPTDARHTRMKDSHRDLSVLGEHHYTTGAPDKRPAGGARAAALRSPQWEKHGAGDGEPLVTHSPPRDITVRRANKQTGRAQASEEHKRSHVGCDTLNNQPHRIQFACPPHESPALSSSHNSRARCADPTYHHRPHKPLATACGEHFSLLPLLHIPQPYRAVRRS
mmetsp:Transcript_25506/g.57933  ORF Transcript_25506/g.57933 Transcript_25506/m.57933 type:complete len:229 (-) Transcript_25506:283-969(-)